MRSLPSNPILKGFNPDPSIIRVGEDYYIATSTFEWFPGVQIHHSRDLINWKLIAQPLNRLSQLDMTGVPDSCGVWAPCLSYDKGTFYLVYSNVKSFDGTWKDTPNYLVTTDDITGDWSEPTYLASYGFDGSLFHAPDGKKWFLSMLVDHQKGKFFGGIVLQEYDPLKKMLIGTSHHIFEGTELGKTEGPHLYYRNGYFYLITAEGGTEYGHAVSMARSKSIFGPYEIHPENPIISAKDSPEHPLQKAGHGDLVDTSDGRTYCTYLVGRPLSTHGRCTLGRETAISEMEWKEDQWLYAKEGKVPPVHLEHKGDQKADLSTNYKFNIEINQDFQALRRPIESSWARIKDERLELVGQESLNSLFKQSLLAHRVQSHHVEVTTKLFFNPESFQQMAGLVGYYNSYHWIYCFLTLSDMGNRILNLMVCDKHIISEPIAEPTELDHDPVELKVVFKRDSLQFSFKKEENWINLGPQLDGSILSDDYVRDENNWYRPAFTGAFIGMCCQDLTGKGKNAQFEYFNYKELEQ